ncbi:polyadenylate-binding protein [Pancytospora epiphaga]|nr:polyadenylate-binding protein [Pancytospora epiphaga]
MNSLSQSTPTHPVVHVGNLSIKTTHQELQTLFSEVAPVSKICLRPRSDMVSAYAFVTFQSLDDCNKIIKELNYYTLHNKQINITIYSSEKPSSADGNIFVKNLPPNLNSKDLNEIFKMFGQIISCKVASTSKGELKGFGYVQYANPKSAKKAIASCKNVKIGSYVLEVEMYNPKIKEAKTGGSVQAAVFTNCYVKNFPLTLTEEKLREVLEKYGDVNSLFFPVNENGGSLGYACANYSRPEDAQNAIENLHNKHVFPEDEMIKEEGLAPLPFYIQKAEDKNDRAESIKRQLEMFSFDGHRSKCNLYVSNIPESFSKDEIKDIFLKFGRVTSFKIESAGQDTQLQYGYICYATPEEAAVAYEKIDGTFLDGNRLQISYYRTKSERSASAESRGSPKSSPRPKSGFFLDAQRPDIDGPLRKVLKVLYDFIQVSADDYEEHWAAYDAEDCADFSRKVILSLVDFPMGHLKEMINEKAALNDYIVRTAQEKTPAKGTKSKNQE